VNFLSLNATIVLLDFLEEFYSAPRIDVSKVLDVKAQFRKLLIALPELFEIEAKHFMQLQSEHELPDQDLEKKLGILFVELQAFP
jgi:hypothetical protein